MADAELPPGDDRDLQLLRTWRLDEAEPPAGMRERIEEQVWQAVLAEEVHLRTHGRGVGHRARSWWQGLGRPAIAASATVVLALVVASWSDGGAGSTASVGTGVNQAGVGIFDATASSLFGTDDSARSAVTPRANLVGSDEIDVLEQVAAGPQHDDSGAADEETQSLDPRLAGDPTALLALLQAAARMRAGADPDDRLAFQMAMRWISDIAISPATRASMLRSLDGMRGIDRAVMGTDVIRGRRGVVLSHYDSATGVRDQYVLDPDGGVLLERRSFTTAYVIPACPPGTFTEYALYEDGQQVDPATYQAANQWADWPQVIAACDSAPAPG